MKGGLQVWGPLVFCLLFPLISYGQPVKIAVLDTHQNHAHSKSVMKLFKQELGVCKKCQVELFPIYTKDGELTEEAFLKAIESAKDFDILHLSWNMSFHPRFNSVIAKLREQKQLIIVAAAGAPEQGSIAKPLADSVMAKVEDVFLIGELDRRGKLPTHAFYGPPLFSAFLPPAGTKGSSFSAILFTVALAKKMGNLKDRSVLKQQLLEKRVLIKDPFPTLKQLF